MNAQELVGAAAERILLAVDVDEITGEDGGPYQPLHAVMDPIDGQAIGAVRLYRGDVSIVTASMASPAIGLDTHQISVFTPEESSVPHLSLDAAIAPMIDSVFHVGVDLLPRVDLQSTPDYLDAVYRPLAHVFDAANADERLPAATGLDPVRRGLRSPWLFATYVEAQNMPVAVGVVDAYVDHWLALQSSAPEGLDLGGVDLADRDRRYRAHLFARATNPLWNLIEQLIGDDAGRQMRGLLVDPHGAG